MWENSERYNSVAQLDICAEKLEREPWNPNRCKKKGLSRGGWEALVHTLGWAWLPVLQPGSRPQARMLGFSQQGPAGLFPHFNPCLHWARVYIQPAAAQAQRRLPMRSVVPSQSLSTLWAPQIRGPWTPELRKSGLWKQELPSLRIRRGSFNRAHGSLCLLRATLFLSLPSSPAFQHTLPDSSGYGQHSRPKARGSIFDWKMHQELQRKSTESKALKSHGCPTSASRVHEFLAIGSFRVPFQIR